MQLRLFQKWQCDNCGQSGDFHPNMALCDKCYLNKLGLDSGDCKVCGRAIDRSKWHRAAKIKVNFLTCSPKCKGVMQSRLAEESNRAYVISRSGYVLEWCKQRERYVPQHRLVMERKIGRRLEKWETVHHRNGMRDDNRIDNLELMGSRHPRGQFYDDWVDYFTSRLLKANPRCIIVGDCDPTTKVSLVNVDSGDFVDIHLV